jgi:hypothetical protein
MGIVSNRNIAEIKNDDGKGFKFQLIHTDGGVHKFIATWESDFGGLLEAHQLEAFALEILEMLYSSHLTKKVVTELVVTMENMNVANDPGMPSTDGRNRKDGRNSQKTTTSIPVAFGDNTRYEERRSPQF